MAKSKKPKTAAGVEGFPAPTPAAAQMNHLMDSMETYTKHRVECFVCGASDTARDMTDARYARQLYGEGWRWVESESCQTIGVACPKCAAMPDEKRNS